MASKTVSNCKRLLLITIIQRVVALTKKTMQRPGLEPAGGLSHEAVKIKANLTSIFSYKYLNIQKFANYKPQLVALSSGSTLMDALWNFEDKLKLSTEESAALLACTAFLFLGLCTAAGVTVLKKWCKRKISSIHQDPSVRTECMELEAEEVVMKIKRKRQCREEQPCWGGVKKVLMSSVRWSRVNKWEEREREKHTALLVSARFEGNLGWKSHNSTSPVWQRPILMGEKCELPRFSGLILYDERGRPVHHHSDHGTFDYQQEEATVTTTLRDLLQ